MKISKKVEMVKCRVGGKIDLEFLPDGPFLSGEF